MINPKNIVRYDYSYRELEELLIFCVCVAGKRAKDIAPRVHSLCNRIASPLCLNIYYTREELAKRLKKLGIGCYNAKAGTIYDIVGPNGPGDLRMCSLSDLEAIKGIGPKTSRFFLMSSRAGVVHATLDTHLLRWMRDNGVENVPKSTPTGKRYLDLEKTFITMIPEGKSAAEFDLEIWNKYSNGS